MHLALPLVDDDDNVWRGILFGLMEATVPKDVADVVEEAFEAEHHLRSGSLVRVEGGKKSGSKRAGRKRQKVESTAGRIVAAFKYKGEG